jgi:rhodanese-related sulfurtransferase
MAARSLSVDPSPVFADAHLPGASWVARAWLAARPERWLASRSSAALLSCRDGIRSLLTASELGRQGYGGLAVLADGVKAWQEAGRRVGSGRAALPDDPGDVWRHPLEVGPEAVRDYLAWEVALVDKAASVDPRAPGDP